MADLVGKQTTSLPCRPLVCSIGSGDGSGARAIEFRQIRYLVAAADHGSFRKAATALNVRESAIIHRIRDLEDEIGVALLVRDYTG